MQQGEENWKTAHTRSRAAALQSATAAATTLDVLVGAVGTLTPPRVAGKSSSGIRNDDDDDIVLHDSDDEAGLLAEVLNTPERLQALQGRGRRSIPVGIRGAAPSANAARALSRAVAPLPADSDMSAYISGYQSRASAYQAAERLSKHQTASAPSSARSSLESFAGHEWQRRSADEVVRSPLPPKHTHKKTQKTRQHTRARHLMPIAHLRHLCCRLCSHLDTSNIKPLCALHDDDLCLSRDFQPRRSSSSS